jgi:alginate O-acetyltransferase complex protein AlgI
MLFNSFSFLFVFLPITYGVFWSLRTSQSRYIWLTATGYVFYGFWDPRFTLLMAFSTLVSYVAGLGFLRWSDPQKRRLCLILPIAIDLSLLGFFKYAGFVLDSIRAVMTALGAGVPIPTVHVILPIGISFYTFHTITYIVDSYRGTIRPTRNIFEFSAYVSLFSQLVAGPIVRFRQIERDLEQLGSASRTQWFGRGASFFAIGLVEKLVIADVLAPFVDAAFADYGNVGTAVAWTAAAAYSLQLYFDFCGYSDMAVGLGYLFGLRIPQNFNSPYKALDPSDFWRRWHISLSTCLRDYLYIPLGGSRVGTRRTEVNLMLTMLIGGLWHGANWTFVVWGAFHGGLLITHRRWARQWDLLPTFMRSGAMLIAVLFGWVLFRSPNFDVALTLLSRMVVPFQGSHPGAGPGTALMVLGAGALALLGPNAFDVHAVSWRPTKRHGFAIAAAVGVCLSLMAGTGSSPFLYFQF